MDRLVAYLWNSSQAADPSYKFHLFVPWMIFCGAALLLWFYYNVEGRKRFFGSHRIHKYIADKILNQVALAAVVGWILIFFVYADANLLSYRIWRVMWLAWLAVIAIYWTQFMIRTYPGWSRAYAQERTKAQYMPQPKAKRPAKAGSR
jgi:hypothetical protein